LEVARAFAATRLPWIRRQRERMRAQPRETPRRFVERESHHLWDRRHLLSVFERDAKPCVTLDHRRSRLHVRPGSTEATRNAVVHAWHRALLHEVLPPLIRTWEQQLNVSVAGYYLRRLKTRWGSCNHRSGHIRLNTELVKKPKDLLEYVVVHEMVPT